MNVQYRVLLSLAVHKHVEELSGVLPSFPLVHAARLLSASRADEARKRDAPGFP